VLLTALYVILKPVNSCRLSLQQRGYDVEPDDVPGMSSMLAHNHVFLRRSKAQKTASCFHRITEAAKWRFLGSCG
jgi:hypothetical protein